MSEEKEPPQTSQTDEWPQDRSIEDILTEAEEANQLISSAKEEAEKGGWVEPRTVEDYLMWFDYMAEKIIKDSLQEPEFRYLYLEYIHEIGGYIAELRCFGIQPSPKPWECCFMKIDPEIMEGLDQINTLAHKYGYGLHNWILAFPNYLLKQKKAEFVEMEFQFKDTVQLVHNVVEQLSCVAVCHHHSNPLQKIDLYSHLQDMWKYADLYACKPKDFISWAIAIWNYRIDQAHKEQSISVEAECDIILALRNSEEIFTFNSPIEEMFWKAWKAYSFLSLVPQHKIGKYKVDFAHLSTKVAVELDGLVAHRTTEQIANDRRRQREIEAEGWKFLRFGGKEIYQDVGQCVRDVEAFITKVQAEKENQR